MRRRIWGAAGPSMVFIWTKAWFLFLTLTDTSTSPYSCSMSSNWYLSTSSGRFRRCTTREGTSPPPAARPDVGSGAAPTSFPSRGCASAPRSRPTPCSSSCLHVSKIIDMTGARARVNGTLMADVRFAMHVLAVFHSWSNLVVAILSVRVAPDTLVSEKGFHFAHGRRF